MLICSTRQTTLDTGLNIFYLDSRLHTTSWNVFENCVILPAFLCLSANNRFRTPHFLLWVNCKHFVAIFCQHQYFYEESWFIWQHQNMPRVTIPANFTWRKVNSYNQYNAKTFSTKTRIVHTSVSKYCPTKYYVVQAIRTTEMCSLIRIKNSSANSGLLVFLLHVAT